MNTSLAPEEMWLIGALSRSLPARTEPPTRAAQEGLVAHSALAQKEIPTSPGLRALKTK